MKVVVLKGLLLLSPLVILMAFFVIEDPMKVMDRYASPVTPGVLMNDRLFKTRALLVHPQDYDAFIFGSSRGNAFKTAAWKRHLPEDAQPYHLAMNDETLFGLAARMQFLVNEDYALNHALVLLDERLLSLDHNQAAHIFREHYKVSGESSVEFYKGFLMAFLQPDFLKAYYAYRVKGNALQEKDGFFWDPGFTYRPETGDIDYRRYDSLLADDSVSYYRVHKRDAFYPRDYAASFEPKPVITTEGRELLQQIASLFVSQRTDYQVVVTPNYSQKTLHQDDVAILNELFGKDKVFDFSGINSWTDCICNYYEERHFKPYIANMIMDSLYAR